jgi:tetratricopeptide (TPR) repeat protein
MLALGTGAAVAQTQAGGAATYGQAESLIRMHQWDDGLKVLQLLLQASPRELKLLNLAGLAYAGKGEPKQANQYFLSALKVDPGFVPALKNLGINEAMLGETQPAEKHLQAALERAPADPVANFYLGELYYKQRDFVHAEPCLSRARDFLAHDPNLVADLAVTEIKLEHRAASETLLAALPAANLKAPAQLTLGVALAEANRQAEALPYLEAAHAAYPASADLSFDVALSAIANKQYPEAIEVLRDLIAAGPETAEQNNLLAQALEADHQTQPAVDALRRAIALSPEDDDNYLDFASLCMDHQAFADAAQVLAVALKVHPASSRLFFERAILQAMQDHYELAEADFEKSAALAPESDAAYVGLGVTYLETGNSKQAIPMLRKRVSEHPQDARFLYLLAEAIWRTGPADSDPAFTESKTLLEKAVHLDAGLVEAHVRLGTIYLREEKYEAAIGELEQAIKLDPNSRSAYSHLAVAYRHVGKQQDAQRVLLRLKALNDRERDGPRQQVKAQTTAP